MTDSEWEEYLKEHKAAAQQGADAFRAFLMQRFGITDLSNISTIFITNSKSTPLDLYLEPISMSYKLPAKEKNARKNAHYELVFADSPYPTVAVNDDGSISIYDVGSYYYQFFLDGVPVFE